MCGETNTYIHSSRTHVWFNNKDRTGYLCAKCYWGLSKVNNKDQEEYRKYKKIDKGKCVICGNNVTKHRYYDEKGIWDEVSHICNICYMRKYYRTDNRFTSSRSGNLSKNSQVGKGLFGEAMFAKVRCLKIISIEKNDFISKYDLTSDSEYGMIQCKLKRPYLRIGREYWNIHFDIEHYFDYLGVLCVDKDMINIERVYMIPEEELYGIQGITLVKGLDSKLYSKWERFRIDEKPYNDAYHNIMDFLKDKRYFGIKDIKKWLEVS